MRSYADILCPDFAPHTGCHHPKGRGDHVMLGTNNGPRYEVVHVAGATAWVRPLRFGAEALVPLQHLRLVAAGDASPVI
jgi:hypothetical protein